MHKTNLKLLFLHSSARLQRRELAFAFVKRFLCIMKREIFSHLVSNCKFHFSSICCFLCGIFFSILTTRALLSGASFDKYHFAFALTPRTTRQRFFLFFSFGVSSEGTHFIYNRMIYIFNVFVEELKNEEIYF